VKELVVTVVARLPHSTVLHYAYNNTRESWN